MIRLRDLAPDTLARQFTLLLAAAILGANLLGLLVLSLQQQQHDRQTVDDQWIERIASLVPALDSVDSEIRGLIAREASTPFTYMRVEPAPLLTSSDDDRRSLYIARGLAEALGGHQVFVSHASAIPRQNRTEAPPNEAPPNEPPAPAGLAVTVALDGGTSGAEWLNLLAAPGPERPGLISVKSRPFLTFLGLSLLCVLGVGALFASRLTKPLRQLSEAAQAAGRGDRSARVPEGGAREMREAARAFNAMQAEISRFDAERMRLLAAVGHDLRTPMTSLRIRAEMVEDDEQRAAMVRSLDEMTVMADGLITYAKDGRDSEPMAALDLDPLLAELCRDRGASYTGGADLQVSGRRVGLGRAIGNLIDNARRYGGGAAVSLSRSKDFAVIDIDDNGPGIPAERLEDMFLPFTRGEDSRSIETGGAGLGLSIARAIIIAHGGRLTLENRTEGGLRARISLQLAR
ncbi:ATP-binding protein [Pararhodobacter oceanensis]|uniref:ATP-binding protein n=1 Tax=Pararhodobacter oceanensis TaxID=2172121 RepID=UPI003A95CF11